MSLFAPFTTRRSGVSTVPLQVLACALDLYGESLRSWAFERQHHGGLWFTRRWNTQPDIFRTRWRLETFTSGTLSSNSRSVERGDPTAIHRQTPSVRD